MAQETKGRWIISHVATVDVEITSLESLQRACQRLGLEFREGQTTYKWFGRSVGDYPLPNGFTEEELGQCEHAIGVPGSTDAYEVGIVKRRDGRPGWTFLFDFYADGFGLMPLVGENCQKLSQAYATEHAKSQARRMGFRVTEKAKQDGSIQLVLQR